MSLLVLLRSHPLGILLAVLAIIWSHMTSRDQQNVGKERMSEEERFMTPERK